MTELPSSPEAEESILAMIIFWPDKAHQVYAVVPDDFFYHPMRLLLYGVLRDMLDAEDPLEPASITIKLRKMGKLDAVGGPGEVSRLCAIMPASGALTHYRNELEDCWRQRKVWTACDRAIKSVHSPNMPVGEWLAGITSDILEASQDRSQKPVRTWKSLCEKSLERYEALARTGGSIPGWPTGIEKLDILTGGMQRGKLWVAGGGTSDGKSALGQQAIIHAAERGAKSAIYSLEMGDEEIVDRGLAMKGVSQEMQRRGPKNREEARTAKDVVEAIRDLPIFPVDVSGIKLGALLNDIRKMTAQGVELFMIDYGQLIESESSKRSREEEVARVSRSLKNIAKTLNIFVLLLSQLNDDGKLRESRALGMDADVVLTISTPTRKEKIEGQWQELRDNTRRIIFVGKVRNGQRDVPIPCKFHGERYTFEQA